jgi:RNA polymerase sigma factor (sigma-70 family)
MPSLRENLKTLHMFEQLSLNELFQSHWKDVYLFARSKTKNHHNAEDLTNVTFTKAFLKIESYDPSLEFKNWIFAICKNTFLDEVKKKKYPTFSIDNHPNYEIRDYSPLIIEQIISEEEDMNTLEKISQLREDEQRIITLYYVDELSYNQITEILNISYANARTRLSRARNNFFALTPMASLN